MTSKVSKASKPGEKIVRRVSDDDTQSDEEDVEPEIWLPPTDGPCDRNIKCKGCAIKFPVLVEENQTWRDSESARKYFRHCAEQCTKYEGQGLIRTCDNCKSIFINEQMKDLHLVECDTIRSKKGLGKRKRSEARRKIIDERGREDSSSEQEDQIGADEEILKRDVQKAAEEARKELRAKGVTLSSSPSSSLASKNTSKISSKSSKNGQKADQPQTFATGKSKTRPDKCCSRGENSPNELNNVEDSTDQEPNPQLNLPSSPSSLSTSSVSSTHPPPPLGRRPGPASRTRPGPASKTNRPPARVVHDAPPAPSEATIKQVETQMRLSGKDMNHLRHALKRRSAPTPSVPKKKKKKKNWYAESPKNTKRKSTQGDSESEDSDAVPEVDSDGEPVPEVIRTVPPIKFTREEYLAYISRTSKNQNTFDSSEKCPACGEMFPVLKWGKEGARDKPIFSEEFYIHCLERCSEYKPRIKPCDNCFHNFLEGEFKAHKRNKKHCKELRAIAKSLRWRHPDSNKRQYLDFMELNKKINDEMCCPGCHVSFDAYRVKDDYFPGIQLYWHRMTCPQISQEVRDNMIKYCETCKHFYWGEEDYQKYDKCYVPPVARVGKPGFGGKG